MPPELLKIYNPLSPSVAARREGSPRFNGQLHCHGETELIYFRKAEGELRIGDHVTCFKKGDLFLIGENLAHYWKHNDAFYTNGIDSVVVHFKPAFLGKDFLETAEGAILKVLLHRAQSGLRIKGNIKGRVVRLMNRLLAANGLSRSVLLLTILDMIAMSADVQPISVGLCYHDRTMDRESGAIEKVYRHVAANFRRKISIQEVAAEANISPHSFCRFFKTHTGKTFVQFLLEVRVDHACTLLSQKQQNLKRISLESGFKNMAGFYKYFKQITGKTPRHYQDVIRGVPF